MRVYWYAPFNNASETELAAALSEIPDYELTVQSRSRRFGAALPGKPTGRYRLLRDLPPPAGEMGERRTTLRQLKILQQRSLRRKIQVRAESFDVVHLHTFNLATDWWAIRRLRRHAPVILQSVHDVRPHRRRLPRRLETILLRAGYSAPDALIVAHEDLKDQLIGELGIPARRINVVPLPVRSMPGLEAPAARCSGDPLVMLFFGTFRRNKGIPILLEAIAQLSECFDISFIFAGRGEADLEEAVRRAASKDSRISAEIGYVSDSRREQLLGMSDLLVLPYTQFNSQSGVLSEDSYGSGRPVIATTVGALGSAVASEGTGWLVAPGDAAGLARMFEQVFLDPSEYDDKVRRVLSIGPERSVDKIAQMFSELYRNTPRRKRESRRPASQCEG